MVGDRNDGDGSCRYAERPRTPQHVATNVYILCDMVCGIFAQIKGLLIHSQMLS
jgi:hypothetical protein